MLPLSLSIEGVYSYQSKQTIDFEQLTNAGLFGIFGKVGSGKSTVLESIGFVLYGDTERMNSKDKISYNMLNLKSKRACIEFEFLNFENKKYLFVVSWNREKKFEKTSSFERSAYEWTNGDWIPLASTDASKIVGLSYENFKRTIIIPQGKFKEFLELGGKDRSEMMKEIFHLQRFDLAAAVGCLKKNTEILQSEYKGKLEGFEEISGEILALKKEELIQGQLALKTKKENSEKLTSKFNELETLKNNLQALKDKTELLHQLNQQKESIFLSEQQVNRFTLVERIFKSLFQDTSNKKLEFLQKVQQKSRIDEEIKSIESELAVIHLKLKTFEESNEQLVLNKKKVVDYDYIIQLKQSEKKIEDIQHKIKEFEHIKLSLVEKETLVKKSLESIQTDLDELKKKRIDPTILLELGAWYSDYTLKINKSKDHQLKIEQLTEEIGLHQKVFKDLDVDLTSWRTNFDTQKIQLESEKDILTSQKTKTLLRKELAHYSSQLHEGENCPLCGSLEHPAVMEVEDVSDVLFELENQIQTKNNSIQEILQHLSNLHSREQQIEKSNSILVTEKELLTLANEELNQFKNTFKWNQFSIDDTELYQQKKNELKEMDSQIISKEVEFKKTQQQLNGIFEKLKSIESECNKIVLDQVRLTEIRKGISSRLEVLQSEEFKSLELSQIKVQKQNLELENDRIDKEILLFNQEKHLKENQLTEQKAFATLLMKQLGELTSELEKNTTQISLLLGEHGFSTMTEVSEILEQTLDVDALREEIKQFHIAVESTQKLIQDVESKVQGREFSMKYYTSLKNNLNELNEELEVLKSNLAKKEGEIQRLEVEYLKKVDLLVEFEKVNNRVSNLGVLSKLFNANGFVNYVSGIYLRNLAENANARFHRITKNQLSLIINDKNEFEVVDYLNNGAARSVKTLSGGQSFQASLCLALALAESIQTQNSSDKNFFFIDEGFGTQDAESVELVYQTLHSLLKENRIVGFISHLAELQEKIPTSITILKDDNTGSYVSQN